MKKSEQQEVGDDLSVYALNLEFLSEKIKIRRKNLSQRLLHQKRFLLMHTRILARILGSLVELCELLDHRFLLTEAAIKIFFENRCTFYKTKNTT